MKRLASFRVISDFVKFAKGLQNLRIVLPSSAVAIDCIILEHYEKQKFCNQRVNSGL